MSLRFVTDDRVALNLDAAGDGQPMVFQHGLCGDRNQTAQVFPKGTGFRRVTLECRGHGLSESGPTERFSIAQFTADLAAMIRNQGFHRPVVGGISMGAAISLRLAITAPSLVRALVIARPAWATKSAPANMRPNALVGRLLAEGAARAEFEATETARHLAANAPDNLASLCGFFHRDPIAVTSALLRQISSDGPGVTEGDLAAIRIPVLVIGHERDEVHPIALALQIARTIPGATFAQITPKATDPVRYRDDFQAVLADFLKGL